jgi:hypothetical protein
VCVCASVGGRVEKRVSVLFSEENGSYCQGK